MQGTAADIIKRAMIEVDAWLQNSRIPARLIMQVHDELVLEVADETGAGIVEPLRGHMAQAATLAGALQGRGRVGRNRGGRHQGNASHRGLRRKWLRSACAARL